MNKIIENFLNIHKTEYSIERLDTETAFEHFANKCIVNKYSNERFDPSDIMTDPGEKGLDGVAIWRQNPPALPAGPPSSPPPGFLS